MSAATSTIDRSMGYSSMPLTSASRNAHAAPDDLNEAKSERTNGAQYLSKEACQGSSHSRSSVNQVNDKQTLLDIRANEKDDASKPEQSNLLQLDTEAAKLSESMRAIYNVPDVIQRQRNAIRALASRVKTLEHQKRQLETAMTSHHLEVESLTKAKGHLETEAKEGHQRYGRLAQQERKLDAKIRSLEESESELMNELEASKNQTKDLNIGKDGLKTSNATLQSLVTELRGLLEINNVENECLRGALAEANALAKNQHEVNTCQQARIKKHTDQVTTLEESDRILHSASKQKRNLDKVRIRNMRSHLRNRRAQNEALRCRLKRSEAEKESLQSELDQRLRQISKLEEYISHCDATMRNILGRENEINPVNMTGPFLANHRRRYRNPLLATEPWMSPRYSDSHGIMGKSSLTSIVRHHQNDQADVAADATHQQISYEELARHLKVYQNINTELTNRLRQQNEEAAISFQHLKTVEAELSDCQSHLGEANSKLLRYLDYKRASADLALGIAAPQRLGINGWYGSKLDPHETIEDLVKGVLAPYLDWTMIDAMLENECFTNGLRRRLTANSSERLDIKCEKGGRSPDS